MSKRVAASLLLALSAAATAAAGEFAPSSSNLRATQWASQAQPAAEPSCTAGPDTAIRGGAAKVVLPEGWTNDTSSGKQYPAIMVLHGWGSNGHYHDFFFGTSERASKFGFVTIMPNGTMDPKRNGRFWDARACCNHDRLPGIDDDAYLRSVTLDAIAKYNIDPARVYVVGHSNGGLMTQIMACQHSDLFSGMVGIAPGPIPAMCWETTTKKVLLIGGGEDKWTPPCFIADNGKRWAEYLKCDYDDMTIRNANYDCDASPLHADSEYDPYRDKNCEKTGHHKETVINEWSCDNGSKKLATWLIGGATHNPSFNAAFSDDIIKFLLE